MQNKNYFSIKDMQRKHCVKKDSNWIEIMCSELFHCDIHQEEGLWWEATCKIISLTVLQHWDPGDENLVNLELSDIAFENPSYLDWIPVIISAAVLCSVLCIQFPTNTCMDFTYIVDVMIPVTISPLIGFFFFLFSLDFFRIK